MAASAELQERAALKSAGLAAAMTDALQVRGVPDLIAHAAGEIGVLAFKRGFSEWLEADHDPKADWRLTPPPPSKTYGQQAHRSASSLTLGIRAASAARPGLDVIVVHSRQEPIAPRRGDQLGHLGGNVPACPGRFGRGCMYRPVCDEPVRAAAARYRAADGPAGAGSTSTLPRCAYQAATPMYGDHGMGVDRPSCTIAAFAPGR